jgi:hypothetical protein
MLTVQQLRKEKIPYRPLIHYHDEIDLLVPDEYAQRASEISAESFKEGPKIFGITIMDGTAKIGRSWKECH